MSGVLDRYSKGAYLASDADWSECPTTSGCCCCVVLLASRTVRPQPAGRSTGSPSASAHSALIAAMALSPFDEETRTQ